MRLHRIIQLDFLPEWWGLGLVALLDTVWAQQIHFHLMLGWRDVGLLGASGAVMAALRLFGGGNIRTRGGLIAEYFSLTFAATCVFGVLSYLALASSGSLVDSALLEADRMLGFDWPSGYHFLLAHPVHATILQVAYSSLFYQALYFCLLMGVMGNKRELREMFWLTFVAGLFTSAGALLFPALGPFQALNADPKHDFIVEMVYLKCGGPVYFSLAQMTGVVSFPSLHTTMALAYAYGFRGAGVIGWIAIAFNALMLCSVPYFGGHYLVDMIAGGAVFALSLTIVMLFARLRANAANASPECAARCGGAY